MCDSIWRRTRISMIFTLLFVLSISVKGQQLNKGLYGGVTASQVDGDYYTGFNKIGWTLGFFMNRDIAYNIHWQAEIRYTTRGVYKAPTDMDPTLYKSSYHILELPLSVHYLFQEKIMVELGTSPELLVVDFFWDESGLIKRSTYPDNRRFGLSVFAGAGYRFNDRIMSGIRYTNSAIPFRDPEEWNNPQYRGYFHNVISLTISYTFKEKQSGIR
jgi:hypothetical protein